MSAHRARVGEQRRRWVVAVAVALSVLVSGCSVSINSDDEPDIRVVEGTPVAIERGTSTRVEHPDGRVDITAPPVGTRPAPAGELRLAGPGYLPDTLDPARIQDNDSAFLARQIWRGLVRLDADLEPQPELAERIDISANRLVYTFTLRAGLTFQDGSPLTAESVALSFSRACNPTLLDANPDTLSCRMYLGDIAGADAVLAGEAERMAGVQAISDTEVVIALTRPTVSFLQKLSGSPALIVDVTETDDTDWWLDPNGSGPFELSDWTSSSIRLTAAASYLPGVAAVQEVTLSAGSATGNALNAFEAGQLDVVDLPPYAIDRARTPGDPLHAGLSETPQLTTTFLLINPNIAPWDDPALREAVLRAFDQRRIADTLLDGSVQPATSLVPPGVLGRDWIVDLPTFDPEAARALIAGRSDFEVPPALYDSGVAGAIAAAASETLGTGVQAVQVEWPTYVQMMDERALPAFVLSWVADYPDPENFLTSMLHSNSPDNAAGYANPDVDALLDAAAVEVDPDERIRLFTEAEQLAVDDFVLLPLYVDVAYTVVQPWVSGWDVSPAGLLVLDDVQVRETGD